MNITNIKKTKIKNLHFMAKDIRNFLIENVSKTGGHIGANLATIELTISLHKVFNSPKDKFIFDTGHQGYTHKILTGRKKNFKTLNQFKGMSRFLTKLESAHDIIDASHAGTAISISSGIAFNSSKKDNFYTIAIVGDGTMVEGMNFEGLNFASEKTKNLIIVLNDNEMAIDKSVGGFKYLTTGSKWKNKTQNFFNGMNYDYLPVEDGHNIAKITSALQKAKKSKKACVVHLKTKKGNGLPFAKKHKYKMHFSVPFDPKTGKGANPTIKGKTMSMVAAREINKLLKLDDKIHVITPATPYASHLEEIDEKYQSRVIDVGMAEQHSVGYCCGLALRGLKPILCIQSTFLQRAYDQLIHDISYMNSDVIILSSRSGFSGLDSATHHGIFDLSYLNTVPNLQIYYPNSEKQLKLILKKKILKKNKGPSLILLPYDPIEEDLSFDNNYILKTKSSKKNLIIFCLLNTLGVADKIKHLWTQKKYSSIKIFCLDQIKPLNFKELNKVVKNNKNSDFVSIEENILSGGLGSILKSNLDINKNQFLNIGIKDKFIDPGNKQDCQKLSKMDAKSVIDKLKKWKKN
jgi:1-deoxy-D-xylulose-5-phosphate synthase